MWNLAFKNECQECKMHSICGWFPVGGRRVKAEGKGEMSKVKVLIHTYEKRKMKLVEIVLRG
jgi:hypothetical protein